MMQVEHLEKITSRMIIDLEFKNITPLHIGVGESEFLIENINQTLTITVNGERLGVIPETTLKGILRRETIKVARSIRELREVINDHVTLIEGVNETQSKVKVNELQKHVAKCPICKLYGTQGLAGKIIIHAAITKNPIKKLYIQPNININMKTKTTKQGALSFHEAIPPNTLFKTKIIINNPTDTEKMLINKLLNNIENVGIQIGKRKTVGYGQIKITRKEIIEEIYNDKRGEY